MRPSIRYIPKNMESVVILQDSQDESVTSSNIGRQYTTFRSSGKDSLWSKFINIARYEDLTFQLVMDCFEDDWFNMDSYGLTSGSMLADEGEEFMHSRPDNRSLPDRLHDNFILQSFFGPRWNSLELQEMRELLVPLYKILDPEVLSDIYGQDIYNLVRPKSRVPIILFRGSNYIGHIYQICPEYTTLGSFIGIRESIYNMLCKVHSRSPVRGVAYYLLTAAYEMGLLLGYKRLELNSPIGPMYKLAVAFGFEDGEDFDLDKKPSVTGYDSVLTLV